jgi:tRNA A58 N-methylase Trm61
MTTEPKTPAQLADDAAEAIRALNHATLSPRDGWEYPADAYSVVGNLGTLVMRLPQVLEQLTEFVEKLHQDGHVKADTGDTIERLYNLGAAKGDAVDAADRLRSALDEMHAALSPLAYQG